MIKHNGDAIYPCDHCPKGFSKARPFRKHMLDVHREVFLKDLPFYCKTVCSRNFATEEELAEHVKIHDNLKCTFCGKLFGYKNHLTKHLSVHTGERPYTCKICEKSFTQEANLKEHTYRHGSDRPFKCQYCDAGFFRRKEMQKHLDNKHPNANIVPLPHDEFQPQQSKVPETVSDFSALEVFPNYMNL